MREDNMVTVQTPHIDMTLNIIDVILYLVVDVTL